VWKKYFVKEKRVPLINLATIYLERDYMNELTKKRISAKLTGRKKSATHRKHISFALTNRKLSNEHKKHIAESMQKYWQEQLYQY
jgi:uncharacterized protein YaiI (UPF0178 family)